MNWIKHKFGQISIGLLISALGLFGTAAGVVIAKFYRVDDKIEVIKTENTETVQRVSTIEEAIKTLKEDNKEIKMDLKELLKRIK